MKISQKGLDLLKELEGFRAKPYDDQTGKPTKVYTRGVTIGYGHLITKGEWNNVIMHPINADLFKGGITEKIGELILKRDLTRFEDNVNSLNLKLNQNEFDALVILCFNIGCFNFNKSSVVKILNGKDTPYADLNAAWKAWNKSQGKFMRGLLTRRTRELRVFNTGIY